MHLDDNASQASKRHESLRQRGNCRNQFIGICLVMLITLGAPAAQTGGKKQQAPGKPDGQDQTVRLKTDLIEIRAVVTDKQGKVITGLNKDDFEISESGHNQVISFFSAEDVKAERRSATPVTSPATPSLPTRLTTAAPPRRTIVFFVDALNMSAVSLLRVKEALIKFIDERLSDTDLAAVIASTGGLGIFSQFTQDKQVLRLAVNRLTIASALQ